MYKKLSLQILFALSALCLIEYFSESSKDLAVIINASFLALYWLVYLTTKD